MLGKLKFAELARKANAAQVTEETNRTDDDVKPQAIPATTLPTPSPPSVEKQEQEKSPIEESPSHDIYVMDEAYFIPAPSLKEKTISHRSKPTTRKMSGFTRMNSYAKQTRYMMSDEIDNADCMKPLLMMDSISNDTKSTGMSSEGSTDQTTISDEKAPRSQHPFLRRKFTEATDPRKLKENPMGRRGVVIDPYQQNKIRVNLKSRLRKIVEERLTVKQIFSQYVESSTLHGFLYTCSDTYLVRRFLWACLMILGAIYFLVKLREGIIEFFEYPFSTLSTIDFPDELTFPAITFCLVNSFKEKELNESEAFGSLYRSGRFPLRSSWEYPENDLRGKELLREYEHVSLQSEDVFEECDWIRRITQSPKLKANRCDVGNFTSFFNDVEEKCFTFNSGKEDHPLLKVSHSGLANGYEALFDMQSSTAFQTKPYIGLKVFIHAQHEPPGLGSSFVLSPGFYYYVNMDMHEVINLIEMIELK